MQCRCWSGLASTARSVHPQPLRKILALNLLGSGTFLLFGVIARRGAAAGMGGDPVPQAMVITGIVVAFSATALAVALLLRAVPGDRPRTTLEQPRAGKRRSRRVIAARRLLLCWRSCCRPPALCSPWRWVAVAPSASPWRSMAGGAAIALAIAGTLWTHRCTAELPSSAAGRRRWASRCAPTGCRPSCC